MMPQASVALRRIGSFTCFTEEIIIGVGLVMIVLIMALIMNPPEALIKRVYHRNSNEGRATRQTRSDNSP